MMDNKKTSHTIAQEKYDKDHTIRYSIKLNLETDKDIIEWLDNQESKQGSIKKLIRQEINNKKS